jgi:hypothetical protein
MGAMLACVEPTALRIPASESMSAEPNKVRG